MVSSKLCLPNFLDPFVHSRCGFARPHQEDPEQPHFQSFVLPRGRHIGSCLDAHPRILATFLSHGGGFPRPDVDLCFDGADHHVNERAVRDQHDSVQMATDCHENIGHRARGQLIWRPAAHLHLQCELRPCPATLDLAWEWWAPRLG